MTCLYVIACLQHVNTVHKFASAQKTESKTQQLPDNPAVCVKHAVHDYADSTSRGFGMYTGRLTWAARYVT